MFHHLRDLIGVSCCSTCPNNSYALSASAIASAGANASASASAVGNDSATQCQCQCQSASASASVNAIARAGANCAFSSISASPSPVRKLSAGIHHLAEMARHPAHKYCKNIRWKYDFRVFGDNCSQPDQTGKHFSEPISRHQSIEKTSTINQSCMKIVAETTSCVVLSNPTDKPEMVEVIFSKSESKSQQ